MGTRGYGTSGTGDGAPGDRHFCCRECECFSLSAGQSFNTPSGVIKGSIRDDALYSAEMTEPRSLLWMSGLQRNDFTQDHACCTVIRIHIAI